MERKRSAKESKQARKKARKKEIRQKERYQRLPTLLKRDICGCSSMDLFKKTLDDLQKKFAAANIGSNGSGPSQESQTAAAAAVPVRINLQTASRDDIIAYCIRLHHRVESLLIYRTKCEESLDIMDHLKTECDLVKEKLRAQESEHLEFKEKQTDWQKKVKQIIAERDQTIEELRLALHSQPAVAAAALLSHPSEPLDHQQLEQLEQVSLVVQQFQQLKTRLLEQESALALQRESLALAAQQRQQEDADAVLRLSATVDGLSQKTEHVSQQRDAILDQMGRYHVIVDHLMRQISSKDAEVQDLTQALEDAARLSATPPSMSSPVSAEIGVLTDADVSSPSIVAQLQDALTQKSMECEEVAAELQSTLAALDGFVKEAAQMESALESTRRQLQDRDAEQQQARDQLQAEKDQILEERNKLRDSLEAAKEQWEAERSQFISRLAESAADREHLLEESAAIWRGKNDQERARCEQLQQAAASHGLIVEELEKERSLLLTDRLKMEALIQSLEERLRSSASSSDQWEQQMDHMQMQLATSASFAQKADDDRSSLKAALAEAEARNAALLAQLESLRASLSGSQDESQAREFLRRQLEGELEGQTVASDQLRRDLSVSVARVEEMEQQLEELRKGMVQREEEAHGTLEDVRRKHRMAIAEFDKEMTRLKTAMADAETRMQSRVSQGVQTAAPAPAASVASTAAGSGAVMSGATGTMSSSSLSSATASVAASGHGGAGGSKSLEDELLRFAAIQAMRDAEIAEMKKENAQLRKIASRAEQPPDRDASSSSSNSNSNSNSNSAKMVDVPYLRNLFRRYLQETDDERRSDLVGILGLALGMPASEISRFQKAQLSFLSSLFS